MARTRAELKAGSRITDYISLGVVGMDSARASESVLAQTGRACGGSGTCRDRWWSDHVIALALFMQVSYREVLRCLLEGWRGWWDPTAGSR